MPDIGFAFVALAVLLLFAPARTEVRVSAALAVCITCLALFQTTGGRGAYSFSATYVAIFAVGAVALLLWRPYAKPTVFIPLGLYLAVGFMFFWDGEAGGSGAVVNVLLAISAWVGGSLLGQYVRKSVYVETTLALLLTGVVIFELVVCVLQVIGVGVFATSGRTLDLEGGRANGTFQHPADVGKVVTLCLVLLLPLMRSQSKTVRRFASTAVLASLVPVALSESRANFIAALAMILLWSVIRPQERGEIGRRILLPAAVGIVALFFLNGILERFQQDPLGGQRQHFTEVALEQLARTPWFGVGPGAYIRVVGQFDALTAEGWPVHNIFLLQAVELGIVGAALFFLPVVILAVRAIRLLPVRGREGDFARGAIAYIPAIAIMGATGWGLLSPGMAALMFFVFGLSQSQFYPRNLGSALHSSDLASATLTLSRGKQTHAKVIRPM